jgi:hypothetical protein
MLVFKKDMNTTQKRDTVNEILVNLNPISNTIWLDGLREPMPM